ncbi:hypothetical protein TCAL_11752 [Tigriopus californicus]|uniref:Innexin n=1 Tax=Tigriopus californicus TaxID=6832 RepID=A0A553P7M3_TIGCA|nr:hypothetical protein TCAL_11752 [Tigriopus californicus]|eukprot:TCALIF_11752-PA protein Name:"Similar to inx2 Innexin inx2 (Schistocerca americana)" AED:0.17 eAED:0.18 QI:0/-1/0/1/-1/1/1/0/269
MFWFPSRIWKWAEGQEINKIVRKVFVDEKTMIVKISDKRMPLPRKGEERFKDFDDSVARLAKWFVKYSVHTNKFKVYFRQFVICEILTVINLKSHILLMHFFLGNVFATFGFKLWATAEMSVEDRDDIFNMIFPKAGKCTFQRMGPSGTIQIQDGLCVLPVNIINEKIYIFFWYWLSILSVVTLFWIIYRVLTSFIVSFRAWELRSRLHNWASKIEVNGINKKLDAFQWFFLSQLGKNLDPRVFQAILNEIDGIPCLDKSVESKCLCFS